MITKHATSRTLLIHTLATLDALRVEHCRQQVKSFLAEGYRNIIFDMSETVYINSSGLGWLVESFQTVRKLGGTFKVLNISDQIQTIFRQAQLDKLLLEADGTTESGAVGEEANFDRLHELMSTEIYLLSQTHQVVARALKLEAPEQIAAEILKGAIEMCHARFGCIFFVDESRHQLRLVHLAGSTAEGGTAHLPGETFNLKPGRLEHQLLQDEDVVWQPLHELDPLQARLFLDFGFSHLLAAPVRGRESAYGILALEGTDATRELLLVTKPLLAAFTQLCGQALENAALSEKLKERNHELSTALERLRESHVALNSAGRLAAVGTVVSGFGHLLNNQLGPLVGYCELLARQRELPEDVVSRIDVIQTAGQEMQVAIGKLMQLSRVQTAGRGGQLNAHECLQVALDMLHGIIGETRAEIVQQLASAAPQLHAHSEGLVQTLFALLHRSLTSFSEQQPEPRITIATRASRQFFHLLIEDNGSPLSSDDLDAHGDPLLPLDCLRRGQIFSAMLPRTLVSRMGGMLNLTNLDPTGKQAIIDLPVD